MKRVIITGIIFLFLSVYGICNVSEDLRNADNLHNAYRYAEENTLLLSLVNKAQGNKEKAEVYWRLARVTVYLGDDSEDRGDSKNKILSFFEQGEEYANKAMELDPGNHLAYYWKSANIGRWGQVKGILNALNKARPMQVLLVQAINLDPAHADSFNVLGELYDELPGFPISFGNIDYSVSLARKCISLHEEDRTVGREPRIKYGYYIKLAKHLYKRNWNTKKRIEKQEGKEKKYGKEKNILEKNFYYEGTISIKNMSDREEAKEIMNKVIAELNGISNRDKEQNDDLADANKIKAGW
ncbi:MAG: hypothetical protein JXB88_25085 [Spirochaetales bacterium]|nr:hypothetical protein [Spirochaetales bacterium]